MLNNLVKFVEGSKDTFVIDLDSENGGVSFEEATEVLKNIRRQFNISFYAGFIYRHLNLDIPWNTGYIGKTDSNICMLDLSLSKRCLDFYDFDKPYSGEKINSARRNLPKNKWKDEILSLVISLDPYSFEGPTILNKEEENKILKYNSVIEGFNTTYGGTKNYRYPERHLPTIYRALQATFIELPKKGQVLVDLITIDFDKLRDNVKREETWTSLYSIVNLCVNDDASDKDHCNDDCNNSEYYLDLLEDSISKETIYESRENLENKKQDGVFYSRNGNKCTFTLQTLKGLITMFYIYDGKYSNSSVSIPELSLHMSKYVSEDHYLSHLCYRITVDKNNIRNVEFYSSKKDAYNKNGLWNTYASVCNMVNCECGGYRKGSRYSFIEKELRRMFGDLLDKKYIGLFC